MTTPTQGKGSSESTDTQHNPTNGSSESTSPASGEPGGAQNSNGDEKKGSESPDTSKLQSAVQSLEKRLAETESKLEEARSESISERTKRQSVLEEAGKYQDILAEKDSEIESWKTKYSDLENRFKAEHDELESFRALRENERQELLKQFPADDRERYQDAERWTLEEVRHLYDRYHRKAEGEEEVRAVTLDKDKSGSNQKPANADLSRRDALAKRLGLPNS